MRVAPAEADAQHGNLSIASWARPEIGDKILYIEQAPLKIVGVVPCMRNFRVDGRARMNAPENIGHGDEKAIIRPDLRDFPRAPVDAPYRRDEQNAGYFLVAIRRREYAGKLFAVPRRVGDVRGDHCNVPCPNRAESLRSAGTNITGKRAVKKGRFHDQTQLNDALIES